jgi:hypothetical protein
MDAVPLVQLRKMFPAWHITRDDLETYLGFTAVHQTSGRTVKADTITDLAAQLTAAERSALRRNACVEA